MDIELVRQTESANDGQSIHLFYDDLVGMYLAFGLSAFYTTMVVNPIISYSDVMETPVVLMNRSQIAILRESVKKLEYTPRSYYCFRLRSKIGTAGYERWMKQTFGEKG